MLIPSAPPDITRYVCQSLANVCKDDNMSSLLVVSFVVTHRSVSSTKPSPFREHVIRLREHVAVNPGAARESALKMT